MEKKVRKPAESSSKAGLTKYELCTMLVTMGLVAKDGHYIADRIIEKVGKIASHALKTSGIDPEERVF